MRRVKILSLIGILLLSLACGVFFPTPTVQPPTSTVPVTVSSPTPTFTPTAVTNTGAPGIGDSLYPGMGNGGYDVQHYTLDLTVNNVAAGDLDGITTIEAKATQDLTSFNVDFIGFKIDTITVNGETATFKRSGQELTITPSRSLQQNASFTVEVHYNGSPEATSSTAIPIQIGWITYSEGSFVMSEPDGCASFYPVNDHPLDKATYTFRVTVPKPFEVAANGTLRDSTDNGTTTTYLFEEPDPMASYLVTVDIADFNDETMKSPDGVPIRNYYTAGLPKDVNKPFARQGEMLDYFGSLFSPYPFDVYGALVLDTQVGTALENQTMSVFGSDMIDPQNVKESELVVAHEMSHQWFGDNVSLADWSDIWLNESFATYSEGLWIEHTSGRKALDGWIKEVYGFVRDNQRHFSPPGKPPADDLFNGGVYYWGALGLHALRLEVGDDVFFEILKTYQQKFAGGNARTSDFIAVAEQVSGKDLGDFFNSWLYADTLAPIPQLGLEAK